MAEYLLRKRLGPDSSWTIGSAGVAAARGMPASRAGVEALAEQGIDLAPHRSRPLDGRLIERATLIVVMTTGHLSQVRLVAPRAADQKTFVLTSFDPASGGRDIEDPIGMSIDTYRQIRDDIDAALPGLITFMNSLEL